MDYVVGHWSDLRRDQQNQDMITRRLLYLNTHRLSAYTWRQGSLSEDAQFENTPEDHQRFASYLQQCRKSHFALLANVAEEGHIVETIPFLRGGDRESLIRRKIGQHFLGTSLATAVSLGYEKTTRKNEKLLISALTNPGHFEPWLQRLNEAEAPLAGIYTVAQLGGQLLKKLGYGKGRSLLLTLQDHSIRESYLVDGQVHFSRMAPITESSIAGIASGFAAESGKLHQYLIGQRLVGRDETLPVYVVAHAQAASAIERACANRGNLIFHQIDCLSAANSLKLKTPPNGSRSDALFLQLLVTAPPTQQFANEAHRHDYRLSQIRQALLGLGAIALLGGLLFSAREYSDSRDLREEAQALSTVTADLDWRYREISSTFPQLGVDNETLRRITSRQRELIQQQGLPASAYHWISQALNTMPNVMLDEIDWKITPLGTSTAAVFSGQEEITTVRASIRLEKSATPRQLIAQLEQFVSLLRRDPGVSVAVTQQPIQIESAGTLRGGDSEDEKSLPNRFTVVLTRRIAP